MADRSCPQCGRQFSRPWELQRHLKRKTPCAPILEPGALALLLPAGAPEDPEVQRRTCRFCGRAFSCPDGVRRHVRETCRIAPNKKNGDAGMEVLYRHTARRQQEENAALRAQVAALAQDVEALSAAVRKGGLATVVGDHAVVAGNITVINVFGSEGTAHVTPGRVREVLDESLRLPALPAAAAQAVIQAALLIYSDPEHPENLTCYLPNQREGNALVHKAGGWEICPLRIVAPPMARRGVDLLFDNQPFENADEYGPLLKELRENEARYTSGAEMRTILVKNKALLQRALESLPRA